MDLSRIQERYAPILKQYLIPLFLLGLGILLLVYGFILTRSKSRGDILAEGASIVPVAEERSAVKIPGIMVDVEGAVINPGVYELTKNARLQDALIASGGLSDKADREKVAKTLNLASRVIDGGKIYIPSLGDIAIVASAKNNSGVGENILGDQVSALININSASSTELDKLPGVGAVTAEKIINNRPYAKIEDLVSKKSVGSSVFEKIKDKITVN